LDDFLPEVIMTSPNNLIQSFLRFFFRHLYTTIAWAYDLVAFTSSMGQWSTWQRAGTDQIPPGRTLEIGHGTGRVLHALSSEGKEVFGIDPSKQMIRITSRRLQADYLPLHLCQAEAQYLPFPNESFQSLLATFPSEYILDKDTFMEAWRVLKTGGVFIVIPGIVEIFGWRGRKDLSAILDEVASLLYRLTGEAIGRGDEWKDKLEEMLKEIPFALNIEFVQQHRAVVLRITAKKPLTQL
jgi:ubiquinone/menaquinone biosynthesis C-methylase UbiE